jgi:hypothetical protein
MDWLEDSIVVSLCGFWIIITFREEFSALNLIGWWAIRPTISIFFTAA